MTIVTLTKKGQLRLQSVFADSHNLPLFFDYLFIILLCSLCSGEFFYLYFLFLFGYLFPGNHPESSGKF